MDESEAPATETPEKSDIAAEKPPEPDKKNRRRSSIGGDILNALMNSTTAETMSPVEPRMSRPRRAVQAIRPLPPVSMANVVPRKKPIRYSFDLGVRQETKSCLKPSSAPILIRKGPAAKSLTQRTAQKVLSKYRKSRSMSKTPCRERIPKLSFAQVCTIRVITPRPEYNPDHLEMPHSDDEVDQTQNPNRERLSTVQLRLTPTSEAQLESMQNSEIVQFRAEMVFGDADEALPTSSAVVTSSESTEFAESCISTASEPSEALKTDSEAPKPQKPVKNLKITTDQDQPKKKSSRRKSLIVGAASPLKMPGKIEKPRFEEDFQDTITEPKRRTRRSLRLNPAQIAEIAAQNDEEMEEDAEKLHEEPTILNSTSSESGISEKSALSLKKRELIVETSESQASTSSEPLPKRNRRKSAGPMTLQPILDDLEAETERKNRRKSRMLKMEDVKGEKPKTAEIFEKKVRKLRSARCLVPSEAPEAVEVVLVDLERDSEALQPSEDVQKVPEAESTPKPVKFASIFMKTPTSVKKSEEIAKLPILEELKGAEPKSPATPPAIPKMFSLFSPKSASKKSTALVDLTTSPASTSTSTPSIVSRISRIQGIRREATHGDSHPETYQFFRNLPENPSVFEDSERILKLRPLEDVKLDSEDYLKVRRRPDESEALPMVCTSSNPTPEIQKLGIPECDPGNVYPTLVTELIEGAEDAETVRGWLRKWKRKVRKEAEKEMKKEKKKKEKKRKRRRDEEDEETDEDWETEDEMNEMDNPLVLIGPTGVGKTAFIRALAKQENMRLLTTGPESLRTGKEMKERLQEAMKSHRVDQQPDRRLTFFHTSGKQEYTRKTPTVTDKEYTQTLIVVEHVDVFFDSIDRNGVGGLLEMVNEARVPIVFTCETDWPRRGLQTRPLEIWMNRNPRKVQKYVQKLIYSAKNVHIDSETISRLSESVNHDLRALITQANFYSLSPNRPLPLTDRYGVSDGFSSSWDTFRRAELKMDRIEHLAHQYSEILEQIPLQSLPMADHPGIRRFWDAETRGKAAERDAYAEDVQKAHAALNGRYSKRAVAMDLLPLLAPMDRVEKRKMRNSRRHLHRFREDSDGRMDGDSLIQAVAKWTRGGLL